MDMISKGQIIHHKLTKTVLESDNSLFCLLTMNHHPVHLNKEYAGERRHGQILVVGTYVLSLVVGLTVPEISFKAVCNLGFDKVCHHEPVFIGDTLEAQSYIEDVKEQNTTVLARVRTYAYNQEGRKVLSFWRDVLYEKK